MMVGALSPMDPEENRHLKILEMESDYWKCTAKLEVHIRGLGKVGVKHFG
jgi:hypothetical protein